MSILYMMESSSTVALGVYSLESRDSRFILPPPSIMT